jgi:undecaprenyl-diphosphatase
MFSSTTIAWLDGQLIRWINGPAGRDDLLDRFVFDVADSSFLKGSVFLAVYCWIWFQAGDRRDDIRRMIVASLIAALMTAAVARLAQLGLPFHPRPLHVSSLGLNMPLSIKPETLKTWSSFPSDHAILFFALCVPIWSWSRWLGIAAFCWALLVVCLPRIYLGYHYPSDILAGAVVGIGLMVALRAALIRTPLPGWIVRWAGLHPRAFTVVAFLFAVELAALFENVRHFGAAAAGLVKRLVA